MNMKIIQQMRDCLFVIFEQSISQHIIIYLDILLF